MRLAKRGDKETIVQIMTTSFKNYGFINWILRTDIKPKRLESLYRYIFDETLEVGKVYINKENNAIALWNSNKKDKFNLRIIFAKLKLILRMGIPTIIRLIKLENHLYEKFPKKSDYYHLNLLAVSPESQGKGYAKKLLLPVLGDMQKKGLPVYLETATNTNVEIYKKVGFSTIQVQHHGEFNVHIMKTTPNIDYQ